MYCVPMSDRGQVHLTQGLAGISLNQHIMVRWQAIPNNKPFQVNQSQFMAEFVKEVYNRL